MAQTFYPVNKNGDGHIEIKGTIGSGAPKPLIISGGEITLSSDFHSIKTESDAATDDLVRINGGVNGQRIILTPFFDDKTVVVKHDTDEGAVIGNIQMYDTNDFTMDTINHSITLIKKGSNWIKGN